MRHSLNAQISAVRRVATFDAVKKLSSRTSEQDMLRDQLLAAAATLEELQLRGGFGDKSSNDGPPNSGRVA